MFGYVTANWKELTKPQQQRYGAVYCGICRQIRHAASQTARLALSYDMAFLALLHMSLYEPEETAGGKACMLHPIRPRSWVDNEYIRYAADMNVVLAYYNALDDAEDDNSFTAGFAMKALSPHLQQIEQRYPRQCEAIHRCLQQLRALERSGCANPDEPAACFGALMAELLVYREDMWASALRQMGEALGRFIYLVDAAVDYRRDRKEKHYNPFLAMETGEDWDKWEQYLVLAMARCTQVYEKLPLVQDKALLDSILYSGVWVEFRRRQPKVKAVQEEVHDR